MNCSTSTKKCSVCNDRLYIEQVARYVSDPENYVGVMSLLDEGVIRVSDVFVVSDPAVTYSHKAVILTLLAHLLKQYRSSERPHETHIFSRIVTCCGYITSSIGIERGAEYLCVKDARTLGVEFSFRGA